MSFVHSLWTKPMIANRRGVDLHKAIMVNVFTYATSAAWLKHLGSNIDLYADGFAKDMLDFIPYDNIYDLKVPTHVPTANWACGKFLVLEKMQLGDIHIDGDVFIKNTKLIETCTDKNYDMVVQSIENDKETLYKYYYQIRELFKKHNIKTYSCSFEEMPSYNCGTIGFNNAELKKKYLIEYFTALNSIIHNKECLELLKTDTNAIPDLVMEQQFLYELANSGNYSVNNLLGDSETMYDKAIELGYQHILGGFKEQQLEQIKGELKYVDFDIYNKAQKAVKYLM